MKEYYDALFYYTTYADMCLNGDIQVDPTRTIQFYKKLYQVIEYTNN